MKFFTNLFSSAKSTITSTVVRSVVSSKLNEVESKLKKGEGILEWIFGKVFSLYGSATNKGTVGTTKVVTENKENVTDLITENYETVTKIITLVKSLDTQLNRDLVKNIITSTIDTIKTIDTEMQQEFEETEDEITEKVKMFETIWNNK